MVHVFVMTVHERESKTSLWKQTALIVKDPSTGSFSKRWVRQRHLSRRTPLNMLTKTASIKSFTIG